MIRLAFQMLAIRLLRLNELPGPQQFTPAFIQVQLPK